MVATDLAAASLGTLGVAVESAEGAARVQGSAEVVEGAEEEEEATEIAQDAIEVGAGQLGRQECVYVQTCRV